MGTIFINTESSKVNEPHKFVFNLSQRLDSRSSNNCCSSKPIYSLYVVNIRKQYQNIKLKIIAPTWNYKFELPDGSHSISDIQDCIEYIIKNHETLTTIPPSHVYH